MKRFINKKKILIFLSIVYIGYVLISQQVIMHEQKNEISKWNTELGKVKMENQKLKDEVTISGKEIYLEKLAREKLGLVKKGEETIIDKKK
ncbi:FtsB family cell division protein [Hathewaya limosa]|uniref:Cell division protein FtsB n=1 Tax=Hathewaya limosa TaxID=1536 RepID=A0ABU0JNB8_HATLI|nr:septum formation initiator family protein [Hathewaya limosa]MDQ0478578.1 cell division protein FtsB [Hathewaya limosa]